MLEKPFCLIRRLLAGLEVHDLEELPAYRLA